MSDWRVLAAAIHEIRGELPALVGADWPRFEEELDELLDALDDPLVFDKDAIRGRIDALFAAHPAANVRLSVAIAAILSGAGTAHEGARSAPPDDGGGEGGATYDFLDATDADDLDTVDFEAGELEDCAPEEEAEGDERGRTGEIPRMAPRSAPPSTDSLPRSAPPPRPAPFPAAPSPAAPPPAARSVAARPPSAAGPAGAAREERHTVVPVYFGTSRDRSDDGHFGGRRGALALGRAEVTIPDLHVRGEIERPKWWKLQLSEDPDKHVTLRSVEVLDATAFAARARADLASATSEALLFIHGYNVTFDEALLRAAQIAYDLQFGGLATAYSWPSTGGLAGYAEDSTNVSWSRAHFRTFLELLMTRLGVETVHVLAHSMGNRLLAETLAAFDPATLPPGSARLRNIFFAAPDIDAATFGDLARAFHGRAERFTLYASRNDKALKASKALNGYQRAGDTEPNVLCVDAVDSIDASSVDTGLLELNHSYFSDKRTILSDIFSVIRHGHPPSERDGLIERPRGDGARYWEFVP